MGSVGGLIVDVGGAARFLPAEVAVAVMPETQIIQVPGLEPPAIGLALAEDRAVAALRVGSWPRGEMILCRVDDELVLLVGARVLASGTFPATGDDAVWTSGPARLLDVRSLLLRAEAAIWEARTVSGDGRRR
jgi:hypothetical protein